MEFVAQQHLPSVLHGGGKGAATQGDHGTQHLGPDQRAFGAAVLVFGAALGCQRATVVFQINLAHPFGQRGCRAGGDGLEPFRHVHMAHFWHQREIGQLAGAQDVFLGRATAAIAAPVA